MALSSELFTLRPIAGTDYDALDEEQSWSPSLARSA